ncbi:MAG: histidine phosphatase family protein [Caldimonas sp.]
MTTIRLLLASLLALALRPALASEADAWAALRRDGAVALVRHGDAPGVGDPTGWKLGDCRTQRNLSDAGRAQARALGERLRAERIAIARVLTSPWCRTVETATLLGAGPVRSEPTFANAYVLSERHAELTAGARALIGRWRGPGVLLVVTHGENINALTGRTPATAELVVVTAEDDGSLKTLGAVATPVGR